ncbi:glucose-1-phosphate cytidylyltransferase [Gillisia sp. Hel_I_86]|uniref:glucose-1-phosphate cytidylyltransferase n=1 Tax=Gillisia sp. Hel_I_86 TaxID=1249981 RepID=UPI00119C38B6|nr:glucose-1-phosphate cytidylyltransferase [Gillisia sp. Hel_I_86]TVZ27519.1 glucose-1-phosphate cytidylyltransferase [Gillisia sp. Hel_I_86]
MKVLILAGGLGSRLSEETGLKPKPMIEIGNKPILWHIMKTYSYYGFNDFIILLGYKGSMIKEYFSNYYLHNSDITFDFAENKTIYRKNKTEPWKVTLIDTGQDTMTGGRIKRAKEYIGHNTFMLTYGDGVSNININNLLNFHKAHGKILTITAVQPEGRFGSLITDNNDKVLKFTEKPKGDGKWINGGYFICEPEIMDYITDDNTIFENEPLRNLAKSGNAFSYKHFGFWKPMDTLRDKRQLDAFIKNKTAPWIKWESSPEKA